MTDSQTDLEDLIKRHDIIWKNVEYCVKRIDVLTVSVCGAGIYTCFELLKFITLADKLKFPYAIYASNEIKFAGIFFLFGIVLNFGGQVLAYHANFTALKHTMCEIEVLRKKIKNTGSSTKVSLLYNKLAQISTKLSLVSMSIALGELVCILVNFF